jgi:hypothetical protein
MKFHLFKNAIISMMIGQWFLGGLTFFSATSQVWCATPIVVTFDALPRRGGPIPNGYGGLSWTVTTPGIDNIVGYWQSSRPFLDVIALEGHANSASVVALPVEAEIGFPQTSSLLGVYVGAPYGGVYGKDILVAQRLRVRGYLRGLEVGVTEWFEDIDYTPTWFAINLSNIDRAVFETVLIRNNSGGAFQLDALTYVVGAIPEPTSGGLVLCCLLAFIPRRRTRRIA